ncbi:hypothetical protein LTS12_008441 [Elasticomyces elasticus]|nr:hypothetical protein LTS12_008441 [Elasticomyces elasticus]
MRSLQIAYGSIVSYLGTAWKRYGRRGEGPPPRHRVYNLSRDPDIAQQRCGGGSPPGQYAYADDMLQNLEPEMLSEEKYLFAAPMAMEKKRRARDEKEGWGWTYKTETDRARKSEVLGVALDLL